MYLGLSGSPMSSLKSKADALKYAIEFTATGEYPNRAPDIKKAKELYNFICENVQLPDVETDQLSNSLIGLMKKLNKQKAETQEKEIAWGGERPVKEDVPRPCSSTLCNQYKCIEAYIESQGLKPNRGEATPEYTKRTFLLKGIGESLWVTLEHVLPKTE